MCDVVRERRENARQRVNQAYAETYGRGYYKACEAYVDFRNVLERPDIDAVLIATPAHWHALMAIMAAQAGKDIYCEKPTATTVCESQALLAAVRRSGRVYQAGTPAAQRIWGSFSAAPASSCAADASASSPKSTPAATVGPSPGRRGSVPPSRFPTVWTGTCYLGPRPRNPL